MSISRILNRHLFVAVGLLFTVVVFASAQLGGGPTVLKPRLEYLHQEVKSDAVVQTMNELDKQGWELFQIIPSWTIKNDNGEASLAPTSYQLFGRRTMPK